MDIVIDFHGGVSLLAHFAWQILPTDQCSTGTSGAVHAPFQTFFPGQANNQSAGRRQ